MFGVNIKKGFLQGDLVVWMILFSLCMISIVEVYSASSNMTYKTGAYWSPVIQHATLVITGLFIAWFCHIINVGYYKLLLPITYFLSIILLLYVLAKGVVANGAARWIKITENITIQPSEIAKISLVGLAAIILAVGYDKKKQVTREKSFKAFVAFTIITCGLIVSENFSTALIIALVMILLGWIANPPQKLFYGIVFGTIATALIILFTMKSISEETCQKIDDIGLHRFSTWVNRIQASNELPADPNDYDIHDNVQVTHAQIAIATCGIVGRGPGQSVERDFLPQAYSDFIYAIIIEEGGLLSGALVMSLYLLLLYRSMRIAKKCKNKYPAYLVMGLAMMLVTQAMINMAVAVGAIPVTGQPLPLVSKGGTSMIITNAYIGIILSVSRSDTHIDKKSVTIEAEKDTREDG